jgi:hypothetical protein
VRHNRKLPTEHVEEIVALLEPDEVTICGNKGDERDWKSPDNPDPDYCYCECGIK